MGKLKYVYRTWPVIKWTEETSSALRLNKENASRVSYELMEKGIPHSILPKDDSI